MCSLADKEYRDFFVSTHIREGIACQVRAMREAHGWTQDELAALTGMAQERISVIEDPDNGRLTLRTLRRLASVFDVALVVQFVSFDEFAESMAGLSPEELAVRGIYEDTSGGERQMEETHP